MMEWGTESQERAEQCGLRQLDVDNQEGTAAGRDPVGSRPAFHALCIASDPYCEQPLSRAARLTRGDAA